MPENSQTAHGIFATTHWSVVLAAADLSAEQTHKALETLCRTYWPPVYAYVRSRVHDPHDAEDLTQEFFFRLLQRNYLAQVDPNKGRFRSFLLVAVNHFLSNERDRVQAVKRGGRVTFISLEEIAVAEPYHAQAETGLSPERLFEQRYAMRLLGQVLWRLREEFSARGKADLFDALKFTLTGAQRTFSYAALAVQLGATEPALKMAARRIRQRYAELLREEIAHTVASPDEVEDEIRHLFAVLGTQ